MPPMSLDSAVVHLWERPHCLWVGAGIGKYLGDEAHVSVPTWRELTTRLEVKANLAEAPSGASYAERLEACQRELGLLEFQRVLREELLTSSCKAILQLAKNCMFGSSEDDPVKFIPQVIGRLAQLGRSAAPLVNFNIETRTSDLCTLLAASRESRVFMPASDLREVDLPVLNIYPSGSGRPLVIYHPHGAVDVSGKCVVTSLDYRSHEVTLAYQLAVHQAFRSTLFIVGMSMEDQYLRDQLERFAPQIRRIIWFVGDELSPVVENWAWRIDVEIIRVGATWANFWNQVADNGPELTSGQLYFLGNRWRFAVECAQDLLGCHYRRIASMLAEDEEGAKHANRLTKFADLAGEEQLQGDLCTGKEGAEITRKELLEAWKNWEAAMQPYIRSDYEEFFRVA